MTNTWDPADRSLLLRSWKASSLATYQAPWKRWLCWSAFHGVPADNPSPIQLALFLSFLFRTERLSPATIRIHKSVVCTFANPENGPSLGNHPAVRHMLKAICTPTDLPPREVWDVQILLEWIEAHPPNPSSFFEVSRHVALLLLLASGRRVHDLTLLSTSPTQFQDMGSSLVLWPSIGSKTDSASHQQSGWQLSPNPYPVFNLVSWIRDLVTLSKCRRGSLPFPPLVSHYKRCGRAGLPISHRRMDSDRSSGRRNRRSSGKPPCSGGLRSVPRSVVHRLHHAAGELATLRHGLTPLRQISFSSTLSDDGGILRDPPGLCFSSLIVSLYLWFNKPFSFF